MGGWHATNKNKGKRKMSSRLDLLFEQHFPYYNRLSREMIKEIKDFGMEIVKLVFIDLEEKK